MIARLRGGNTVPVAAALAAAPLVVLPFVLSSGGTGRLAVYGTYVIAIAGIDLLLGQAGAVSLGQAAFMAFGAYTTAVLIARHGVPAAWAVAAGAGAAALAGLAVALVAARLRPHGTSLVTLALALALPSVAGRFPGFTGGAAGIALPHPESHLLRYGSSWAAAALLLAFALALASTRFGRALRSTRDNPVAAAACGVHRLPRELAAACLSAAYGGVAGGLLALDAGGVDPSMFRAQLSLLLAAGALAGGLGALWAAVPAALVIGYLVDLAGAIPAIGPNRPGPAAFVLGAALAAVAVVRALAAAVSRR